MILLTRLDGTSFVLNSDQIQSIESTPDTSIISLVGGKKFIVSDSREDIIEKVVVFKNKISSISTEQESAFKFKS